MQVATGARSRVTGLAEPGTDVPRRPSAWCPCAVARAMRGSSVEIGPAHVAGRRCRRGTAIRVPGRPKASSIAGRAAIRRRSGRPTVHGARTADFRRGGGYSRLLQSGSCRVRIPGMRWRRRADRRGRTRRWMRTSARCRAVRWSGHNGVLPGRRRTPRWHARTASGSTHPRAGPIATAQRSPRRWPMRGVARPIGSLSLPIAARRASAMRSAAYCGLMPSRSDRSKIFPTLW